MEIRKIQLNEEDNLELIGINEKGKEESTYIAIPPAWETRIDIISTKNIKEGYTLGCENDVIVIQASGFGNKIVWAPTDIIVKRKDTLKKNK